MANFNKVILAGNLVRDNEIRHVQNDVTVLRNAIAVNRKYKEKDETMFVDIVFFGRLAETINTYTSKGSPILIEGRLSQNTWEQEGTKRSKHEIIVENFQFLGSKGDKPAPAHDDNAGRFNAPSDLPDDEDLPF